MIIRLQHIGLAVENLEETCKTYERVFGLKAVDFRNDQGKGHQLDARILFPNECWLHLVQNWNPASRVNQFLRNVGEGLEHICLETDDIEADVARLRGLGVPIFQDKIFNAPDGFEAFVYPDDAIGFTVELLQRHDTSWGFAADKLSNPNVLGLQHIGVAVRDVEKATKRFAELFDIPGKESVSLHQFETSVYSLIKPGNQFLWLTISSSTKPENRIFQFLTQRGEGLEHLCIECADIREGVKQVQSAGVPLFEHKIYLDRPDGYEAFVYPEYNHGVTVELIEPHATSHGYRPQK